MTEKARRKPYCWASWITKLLAGEDRCWYKAWYKAHFQYAKTPDNQSRQDFFKEWTERHDAITAREAARLRGLGYVVRVEDDAEFKLTGESADVAAKPDLVGVLGDDAVVIDAKSGRHRDSDGWQVSVYQFGLGLAWLAGFRIRGAVAYQDENVSVPPLDEKRRDRIVEAIRAVAAETAPRPTPSNGECRYCDVAACEYRKHDAAGDATRFF